MFVRTCNHIQMPFAHPLCLLTFALDTPQTHLTTGFFFLLSLTNKEDDTAVTLPLIHGVDLVRSWRKSNPEVFDLSRIEGHQRPISLGSPEVFTFPGKKSGKWPTCVYIQAYYRGRRRSPSLCITLEYQVILNIFFHVNNLTWFWRFDIFTLTFKKEDLPPDICHCIKASLTTLGEQGLRPGTEKFNQDSWLDVIWLNIH